MASYKPLGARRVSLGSVYGVPATRTYFTVTPILYAYEYYYSLERPMPGST